MWRDLMAWINAGLGHEEKTELQPGSLAIFCPACPQPGINLPKEWNQDPKRYVLLTSASNSVLTGSRWLYTRSFAIDGNFSAEHLKMRRPEADIALSPGGRYMVEPKRYELHLGTGKEINQVFSFEKVRCPSSNVTSQKSLCSDHKAVNYVNTSKAHLTSTGIGATACARHGCFFPNSVVDFQKGER